MLATVNGLDKTVYTWDAPSPVDPEANHLDGAHAPQQLQLHHRGQVGLDDGPHLHQLGRRALRRGQGPPQDGAAAQQAQQPDVAIFRDQVLTLEEVRSGVSATLSGGRIPQIIIDKAQALGFAPGVLIENQAKAYGFDGSTSIPDVPQGVGAIGDGPTDIRSGKRYLKTHLGVPAKGASYLAANIQQESSWDGMRDWPGVYNPTTGQMDGTSRNGGLVSWASWSDDPARLGVIENYLGKSIDKASHADQLKAMMWEMKTSYPDQYRIFMNPNSSDRQLRRASSEYWGYGHEGARFGTPLTTALAVN